MEKNDGRTELWLFPIDGSKARRLTAGDKDSDPQWSPDGKWIAFAAKRKDDEEPQVYLIAPDGGEAVRADDAGDRRVGAALVSRQQAHRVRVVGLAGLQDRQGAGGAAEGAQGREGQGARDRALRISLLGSLAHRWARTARLCRRRRTGRARDLLAGTGLALQPWDPTSEHYDIGPDGRELALTVDLAAEPRMMNAADIAVVNVDTGRHRVLTSQSGFSDEHPRYSPDGAHVVWHSYNLKRAFNDQGHLTLVRAQGRRGRGG